MAEQESSDDEPQLSAHALAALHEFYAERAALEQQVATSRAVPSVEEDWQLSQFWYDESTASTLAAEVLRASGHKRIACISCPTLFAKIHDLKPVGCQAFLLEYDKRFQTFGDDFVFYDYRQPLNFPHQTLQRNSFDFVAADPPFLSDECLRKVAETITFLAKDKVLVCTGDVMADLVWDLLGAQSCDFVPRHTRNLANEFRCYTNYPTKLSGPVDTL